MAKYNFKIADDGSTMDSMLKMLSMLQDQDYSVSVDADNHTLTVITEGKRTQNNSVKKTIKKTRRRLLWRKAWKSICHWVAQKGYWIPVLIGVPIIILGCRTDLVSLIMAAIWIDAIILVFSTG